MLKWAVGQKNPASGQLSFYNSTTTSAEESAPSSCKATYQLHVARRRNTRKAVRKASVRTLRRIKHDKENQPCLVSNPESLLTGYQFLYDMYTSFYRRRKMCSCGHGTV